TILKDQTISRLGIRKYRGAPSGVSAVWIEICANAYREMPGESEGAAGSGPPPPPYSGSGGGDGCRPPEGGASGAGGAHPPRASRPRFVHRRGATRSTGDRPIFLMPPASRSVPYGALSVGLNFGKAAEAARNQRFVSRTDPRGCGPSNAASRSCSDAVSVGEAPAAAVAPAIRRRRARISVRTPSTSTPAGASHNSAACPEDGGLDR